MPCDNDREFHLPSGERGHMLSVSGTPAVQRRLAVPREHSSSLDPACLRAAPPSPLGQSGSLKESFKYLRRAVALGCIALFAALSGTTPALAERNTAPKDAEVYIIWPSDGTVVEGGKLWVRMGLRNMGISPKGVHLPNVGHHHLLIDTDLGAMDEPIPSDRNHLHFGAGETEARIELPPGKHTLQLLLGDENHVPHNPPVFSKKITITVR